jgi:hypothetical protein
MVNTSINLRAACLDPLKSGFDPDGAEQLKGKLRWPQQVDSRAPPVNLFKHLY